MGQAKKRRSFYKYVIYLYHCLFIRGHKSSLLYKKDEQSEKGKNKNLMRMRFLIESCLFFQIFGEGFDDFWNRLT